MVWKGAQRVPHRRGRVVMRAKTHFEPIGKTDRQAIIVDEIPLPGQQVSQPVAKRSASWFATKKIEGISDLPRRVRQVRHAHCDRAEARRNPGHRPQ